MGRIWKIWIWLDWSIANSISRESCPTKSSISFRAFDIDLDIDIIVYMDYVNGKHVPVDIYYEGFWDVMFFKPERAEFRLKNTNYFVE